MTRVLFAVCLVEIVLGLSAPASGYAQEKTEPDWAALRGEKAPAGAIWLETLDLKKMTQGWGQSRAAQSIVGMPLTLKGAVYPHGIGTHAQSEFVVDLKGVCTRFAAVVGVDDETQGKGSAAFEVWVDDDLAAETGVMHGNDEPKRLSADLTGARHLILVATEAEDGNGFDHTDWAGAVLWLKPGATERPEAVVSVTPEDSAPPAIASGTAPEAVIHGPRVVGATPGRPFLFLIPATGDGPLRYAADGLPAGLVLDANTGIISGALQAAGTTEVALSVTGPKGPAKRTLRIVAGENKLALTPPMGWNSWYVWGGLVDDAKMRAAADGMVKSGLAAHGYQYINIDDCWEGVRDAEGAIRSNERFPDMKALGDYIHSKGLKFGIYTSPGPKTCAGFEGSYGHEDQDARTYAQWGVDFVKHDWCSYGGIAQGNSREELMKPYRVMQVSLAKSGRDMVYSLCQYGMGDVWKWGPEVAANLWRTTGDSGDSWGLVSSIGFKQNGLEAYAGPGHWNDPDMIQVGKLGMSKEARPTRLTPHEQVAQMTLWAILAAPLLLSCDLTQLDQFTVDLLTNDEVLDVNQDPLGQQGKRYVKQGRKEVWARPLEDGAWAVGLFNLGYAASDVTVAWSDLGLSGKHPARDLWQKKDLGAFDGAFTAKVPGHGAAFVRVGK